MKKIIFFVVLLCWSCNFISKNRQVNIFINPAITGWYFIEIKRNMPVRDTDVIRITLLDSMHTATMNIHNHKTSDFNVFNYDGTELTRVKFTGMLQARGKVFFSFYNPTSKEYADKEMWQKPDNETQLQLFSTQDQAFDKYYGH